MMSLRMKISPPVRLTWKPGWSGNALAQRVERQLLAPLALDVQQVADVAELAVQVAPHRRFVDGAHRQAVGAAGLLVEEALDPLLVAAAAVAGPGVARQRQRRARVAIDSRSTATSSRGRHGFAGDSSVVHARYVPGAIELPDLQRRTRTLERVVDPGVGVVQERVDPRLLGLGRPAAGTAKTRPSAGLPERAR